jgi:hypothetical protein
VGAVQGGSACCSQDATAAEEDGSDDQTASTYEPAQESLNDAAQCPSGTIAVRCADGVVRFFEDTAINPDTGERMKIAASSTTLCFYNGDMSLLGPSERFGRFLVRPARQAALSQSGS